jgi:hypothetical protein
MEQAMMNVATLQYPTQIRGLRMVWELCSTLLTEKSAKNADISMEMYDSQCRSTNCIDGLKALIDDRDGLDITTSRALKDHIMVNPEFVDDEFHDDACDQAG